jgi:hypothetical protein
MILGTVPVLHSTRRDQHQGHQPGITLLRRGPGLPVIDTTGRTPKAVAAELAKFIQSLYENQGPAHPG